LGFEPHTLFILLKRRVFSHCISEKRRIDNHLVHECVLSNYNSLINISKFQNSFQLCTKIVKIVCDTLSNMRSVVNTLSFTFLLIEINVSITHWKLIWYKVLRLTWVSQLTKRMSVRTRIRKGVFLVFIFTIYLYFVILPSTLKYYLN